MVPATNETRVDVIGSPRELRNWTLTPTCTARTAPAKTAVKMKIAWVTKVPGEKIDLIGNCEGLLNGKRGIKVARPLPNPPPGFTATQGREYRGGRAFLDTKSRLHKWTNCSMVTAAMPIQRSRSHETVTQEPLIEV
jgi:hypothetical protein